MSLAPIHASSKPYNSMMAASFLCRWPPNTAVRLPFSCVQWLTASYQVLDEFTNSQFLLLVAMAMGWAVPLSLAEAAEWKQNAIKYSLTID